MFSCGHKDEVELLGKHSERRKKIEYFERSGLCRECYKRKMQKLEQEKPFIFNISALPYIDDEGNILLTVWFSGNTREYKDDIKSLGGYRWSERESADDFFSISRSPLCWNKVIKEKELEEEIKKATSIGAESIDADDRLFSAINYQIALDKQKEWKDRNDKISTLGKPKAPDVLVGHRWNQKIYGKPGNYSIYPDGEKVSITDEEAEEIRDYIVKKEEYKKKIEEIKNA